MRYSHETGAKKACSFSLGTSAAVVYCIYLHAHIQHLHFFLWSQKIPSWGVAAKAAVFGYSSSKKAFSCILHIRNFPNILYHYHACIEVE